MPLFVTVIFFDVKGPAMSTAPKLMDPGLTEAEGRVLKVAVNGDILAYGHVADRTTRGGASGPAIEDRA